MDISLPKTNPILLGACYRPPGHATFYDKLEQVLLNLSDKESSELILMGDMNTNVSGCAHPSGKMLEDLCHSFGLEQLTCESIIDLISVLDKTKISESGTITYGISDHNIIFCTRKTGKKNFLLSQDCTLKII